jgi:hypothetical protein
VSAGFFLRGQIKEGILAEAPGGERWPPLHPWSRLKLQRWRWRRYKFGHTEIAERVRVRGPGRKGGKGTALRRLARAVRYRKFVDAGPGGAVARTKVRVGFLSRSAARLAAYHAGGPHTVPVTPAMRRLFFAVGLGLKAGTKVLRIPRRAHVELVERKYAGRIKYFIGRRVASALAGGSPRGVSL